jgi:hypothetical protein
MSNFRDVDLTEFHVSITDRFIQSFEVAIHRKELVELHLQLKPVADKPFAEWTEYVRLRKGETEIEVPIRFLLKGKFYGRPSRISLPHGEAPSTKRIVIAAADDKDRIEIDRSEFIVGGALQSESSHTLSSVLNRGGIAVFKVTFSDTRRVLKKLEVGGRSDMRLDVYLKGCALPVSFEVIAH